MRIREQVAQRIVDEIAKVVRLPAPPTVIAAPPSEVAAYPAMAIWLERADTQWSQDVDVEMDGGGLPIGGASATDPHTGAAVFGPTYQFGDGATLGHIGTLRGSGRLWIGARHAAKREEIEDVIVYSVFQRNPGAPGRLVVSMAGATVAGYQIPFGHGTCTLESTQWTDEFAFSERLWSWIAFDVDVPILAPRNFPLMSQYALYFAADLRGSDVAEAANLTGGGAPTTAELPDLRSFAVDADGDITEST